ncbi:class I SAM-dependent methyltransferase [Pseudoponticoccus marisrubri]|uniref:MFS transporter n=1 Tax=Pseudoponticoccus marisrubri TaxID=1685382 RepID=A0A0W7WF85_9RHOB|nr:methyltransferase [Pseudoponticoccus marisrubri]KUF09222.1 MFS transporter [Pseudoponticoccus marisrubri]
MSTDRLGFALASGLTLPAEGRVVLFGPPGDAPLPDLAPERLQVVQRFRPDFDAWEARGIETVTAPEAACSAAIVTLPRARDLAEARIAEACAAAPGGLVVVDGAKTDGMDAMIKALRARVELLGQVSKAHGKVVWFNADTALARDWARTPTRNVEGAWTAPGVFSAEGVDPASELLVRNLPLLAGPVADLGAGWGWMSRAILRTPHVTKLYVVEADLAALDCARLNIDTPKASFHWADATRWEPPSPVSAVVMNPPFHQGRRADPALGQAFIAAAARMLDPRGALWMVANRHLPYEGALAASFRDVTELEGGTSRFKLFHAARPSRNRR